MRSVAQMKDPGPTSLRVVVSPGPGRIRLLPPERFRSGSEWVQAGQAVARLEQGPSEVVIQAPIEGRVSAVMVLEGEPVVAGQPVMAIESEPLP